MGKSTVSTMLSHLNNPIHDADKTVHELMNANGRYATLYRQQKANE